MTFKYKYRKQILIGILLVLIIGAGITSVVFNYLNKPKEPKKALVLKKKTEAKKEEDITYLKVDIKGEINAPGIYSMLLGDRVIDVIEKAGGLTENADTTVINLSKKVIDEMVIVIYSKEEILNYQATKEKERETLEICTNNEKEIVNNACITTEKEVEKTNQKVNINTASKEELMTITGIGESKAESIIKYRHEHEKFESIEELQNIKGIGEGVFAKIKESITI